MIENSAEWWEEQARAYALSASNLEEELRAFRADSRIKAANIEQLKVELRLSRLALWAVYWHMGFDCDGDKTPDALMYPPLDWYVVEAAQEFC